VLRIVCVVEGPVERIVNMLLDVVVMVLTLAEEVVLEVLPLPPPVPVDVEVTSDVVVDPLAEIVVNSPASL
jgi:hypothetical protein